MPDAGDDDIDERERQHEFPGEVHQLIHAQARQRAANPDEHENDGNHLGQEPNIRRNPGQERHRRNPAAKEQRDAQADDGKHAQIFAEEKEREFEAGILGEIAGDDFGFGFRQVKRAAVGFRQRRDEKQDEPDEAPRRERKPVGDAKGIMVLRSNDVRQLQRADNHHHGHSGKNERNLVTDHLRDGAHRTEQRVFIAARPAGHEHRNFHGTADGKKEQQARIEVRHGHVAAERQNGVGQQHRNQHHDGREKMHHLVGGVRNNILLGQRFDAVRNKLTKAAETNVRERNAHAVGAVAVLDATQPFAFNDRDDGEYARKNRQHQHHRKQARHQRLEGFRNTGQHQLLQHHEELVDLINQT